MSGVQEILLISAIVLGIFFIPRMIPGRASGQTAGIEVKLSGKMRMAIAVSVIYPALAAAYFQPWRKDPVWFIYIGLGPVALGWLFVWVFRGIRNR